MNQITVGFQTYKEATASTEKKWSKVRAFDIEMAHLFQWAGWQSFETVEEEDNEVFSTVKEYMHATIRFYAVSGNDELHINEEEIKKVENLAREHMKTRV